eukprot:TRINITY_DN4203_c0_g1_i4.p1 TRINITY_DN4203_c0_g1~~TRINITY_DN4203_c0_g1_i4.p1  ORF type:complete len:105 (+),score=5.45 TRINITY_DN4203_c0_g1_i4:805-1119(+)
MTLFCHLRKLEQSHPSLSSQHKASNLYHTLSLQKSTPPSKPPLPFSPVDLVYPDPSAPLVSTSNKIISFRTLASTHPLPVNIKSRCHMCVPSCPDPTPSCAPQY